MKTYCKFWFVFILLGIMIVACSDSQTAATSTATNIPANTAPTMTPLPATPNIPAISDTSTPINIETPTALATLQEGADLISSDTKVVGIGYKVFGFYGTSGQVVTITLLFQDLQYHRNDVYALALQNSNGEELVKNYRKINKSGEWMMFTQGPITTIKEFSLPDTDTYYINIKSPSSWELNLTVESAAKTPVPETGAAIIIPTPMPGIGSIWIRPADGMEMVYVPEGEFTMGSDDGADDEKPAHQIYLNAYWIDRTEVTNAMYAKCVAEYKCNRPGSSGRSSMYTNQPVTYVNWDDAQGYCTWAGVRLPTEAEWEKAARGTDGRVYPWGNDNGPDKYYIIRQHSDPKPVGSFPAGASPYGVLDMAGSAGEWVFDWYSATYYQNSPLSNPQGPDSGYTHVLRGSSWSYSYDNVRSASRLVDVPSTGRFVNDNHGFRCALGAIP